MSINRIVVVLPLLAGLVLAGTAVARMMPVQTVRDSVYQTCAHNGVHFNKQGHANCGLHKGWTDGGSTEGSTGSTGGSEPGNTGDQGQTSSGDAGTSHGGGGGGHAHHAKPAHEHGHHSSHGHSGSTVQHGHSGHASSHGHGRGHSKG
ncbi:MAG TPA: hypothetical protein VFH74_07295 [Gaiellales bacterium]|nr:hypothetical protein [Gaiellales bacterium]